MHYLNLQLRYYPKGYQFPKAEPGQLFHDELEFINEAGLIVYRPFDNTMHLPNRSEWETEYLDQERNILEDFFVLEGVSSIYDHLIITQSQSINPRWIGEDMQGNDYADFEHNMQAITTDVMTLITQAFPTPESRPQQELVKLALHYLREEDRNKPMEIEILTQWTVESSVDWETQIEEVDSFTYVGLANIHPAKKRS